MSKYGDGAASPFGNGGGSLEKLTTEVYDMETGIEASGRIVAKRLPIGEIWPDVRQPRRAIPLSLRGEWDGDPDKAGHILGMWHEAAETVLRRNIKVHELLMQYDGGTIDPGVDEDGKPIPKPPIVEDYLDLVTLAASIRSQGLQNPIRVVPRGGGSHTVESGERRLMAHHLLALHGHHDYERIPATVMNDPRGSVWRQAAENGARKPLNAIGMARQLALLIMDMYEGDPGVAFDDYETLVLPGECDRRFYAQVANGNNWRVKRGFGQRVLDVTGLKSAGQIRQYRALLSIPDELWVRADVENMTEFGIRQLQSPSKQDYTVTTVTVSGDYPPTPSTQITPSRPSPMRGEGDGVRPDSRAGEEDDPDETYSTDDRWLVGDEPKARAMLQFISLRSDDPAILAMAKKLGTYREGDLREDIAKSPHALDHLFREIEVWSNQVWDMVMISYWNALTDYAYQFYKRASDMHADEHGTDESQ